MIHDDNPFLDSPEQRDPLRRLRGRLSSPVTIVTSGGPGNRTGLTVSSLMVIEGDPGLVKLVIGPGSDLWESVESFGSFVVHVCREADRHLAEVFAGLRPSPGGPFAGADVTDTDSGPLIDELGDRAICRWVDSIEVGYSGLVTGEIISVDTDDLVDPLVYFRGRYRALR
ncbi:MAG TPA: flavin reductase family protein [Acidimicrobiia bacterium]